MRNFLIDMAVVLLFVVATSCVGLTAMTGLLYFGFGIHIQLAAFGILMFSGGEITQAFRKKIVDATIARLDKNEHQAT